MGYGRFSCPGGVSLDHDCYCPRCISIRESRMYTWGTPAAKDTDLKGAYIIWNPNSTLPPKQVYANRPDAIRVAHLMAVKNPGEQFAVCKIVGSAKPAVTVKFESFSED